MGQVTAMKRGSTWQYRFEGAMIDGKRKRYTKGGFRTKAEALEAGNKAKAEYDGGTYIRPSDISLSDYIDYWLEHHVKGHKAYETYNAYESAVRLHIKPQIGKYKLSALSPAIIQSWIDDYLRDEKHLSTQSIANFAAVLSSAMKYAVHPLQYLKISPCQYVQLPKIPPKEAWKDKVDYVLSQDDWKAIVATLDGTDWLFPVQLMYHTGMRIGECCALDLQKDVDFETHTLTIRRQLRKVESQWTFIPPKYNSIRSIYMGPTLEKLIRRQIARKKENMLKYGELYTHIYKNDSGAVYELPGTIPVNDSLTEVWKVCRENGSMITPDSMKYVSRIIKSKIGLEYFHPHCIRHTHGTILAQKGASPKTIMERLGHKNITTTMHRYVFNTQEMKEEAARLFESAL